MHVLVSGTKASVVPRVESEVERFRYLAGAVGIAAIWCRGRSSGARTSLCNGQRALGRR
jgi:hypothetical protein